MDDFIKSLLAVCGGVSVVGGAVAVVVKWLSPAVSLSKRIEKIERNQARDLERLDEHEETQKLLCRGLLCLLEVAENDVKESPENLKRIQSTKLDIQNYLIQR